MKAEDLGAMRIGAELQGMMPYLDSEVDSILRSLVNGVMSDIQAGTLTPEKAMQRWIEYASYVRIQKRLLQRVRVGQDVGKQAHGVDLIPEKV